MSIAGDALRDAGHRNVRRRSSRIVRGLLLGALAGLTGSAAASVPREPLAQQAQNSADFGAETGSADARQVANWVTATRDNHGLPFIIVDKKEAKVFVFDSHGQIRGAAPALLGLARGDDTVPGIGQRRLASIRPDERTTPAGRFEAAIGNDFEQDVLWIDYDSGLSLHRVIVGSPADRRHARLASPTPLDNRISYGCINVPARFYDTIVAPAFRGTVGIVYILPETRPIAAVFPIPAAATPRP